MKVLADVLPFSGVAIAPPGRGVRLESPAAPARPAPAPSPDEAALCASAMTGDRDAWSALVQKHNHRVVVTLLARGVRIDRAKDIAQEAWMRLIEQQKSGKLDRLQLPGLAITQAVFLSLEAARRESGVRKHEQIDEPAVAARLADPREDAEARMLTGERVERALEVLSGCSPSAKQVFRLAYGGDGLSHAEVAERVGLSLQRVRQILCEVRAKLRTALEGSEEA
jgi:RNA polymerase sigma-70 factor (ECF subfamily)